jgi:DNA invertase Pin-like site-specific DNA recombinase
MLAAVAELERHTILEHTNAGRTRAQANGIKFGPKFKLTEHQRQEALKRRTNGETLTEIAKSYNVSYMTIARLPS